MTKVKYCFASVLFLFAALVATAQEETPKEREGGHTNQSKFEQLYDEFSTPNAYRTASGAPGHEYYQQQVNYVINVELDDKNHRISGEETITYINNSPDDLEFLWVQLDQNIREKDSKAKLRNGDGVPASRPVAAFAADYIQEPFDGGFVIEAVKDASGKTYRTPSILQ